MVSSKVNWIGGTIYTNSSSTIRVAQDLQPFTTFTLHSLTLFLHSFLYPSPLIILPLSSLLSHSSYFNSTHSSNAPSSTLQTLQITTITFVLLLPPSTASLTTKLITKTSRLPMLGPLLPSQCNVPVYVRTVTLSSRVVHVRWVSRNEDQVSWVLQGGGSRRKRRDLAQASHSRGEAW